MTYIPEHAMIVGIKVLPVISDLGNFLSVECQFLTRAQKIVTSEVKILPSAAEDLMTALKCHRIPLEEALTAEVARTAADKILRPRPADA